MAPIDQTKVNEFLVAWNQSENRTIENPLWREVPGIFAPIGLTVEANSVIKFNPNFGFPLKLFINSETSEIKSFDARRFI